MANILIFFPTVDRAFTENKCFIVGRWLREAGHTINFLIWDEPSETVLKQLEFPYSRVFPKKLDIPIRDEAKKALELLSKPVITDDGKIHVPTYGDLFAFDDFLGCAQCWDFPGANLGRPDAIITSVPGMESACPEDSSLSLGIDRFAKSNQIPLIAIEIQSLKNKPHLQARKVDFLLTKEDPRTYPDYVKEISPLVFPVRVAHRYCFRMGKDLALESFLNEELNLRKSMNLKGNEKFLYMQMHLGWKTDVVTMLQQTNKYVPELVVAGFELLISTNPGTVRRSYTEADIVRAGLIPKWLGPWSSRWRVADGGAPYAFALISEAMLAPWEGGLVELLRAWGMPIIKPGQEGQLDDLMCSVSLVQAVEHLVPKMEEKHEDTTSPD